MDEGPDGAIERLEAPPTVASYRGLLAWLRGERQRCDDGEKRHLRVVDFGTPGAASADYGA